MSQQILAQVEASSLKTDVPQFSVGDSVDVHTRILEGTKERIQVFSGTVIAVSGSGTRSMFTVRRIVTGEGVERKFPLHSPKIAKVEVKRSGVTRRAKLYYLRDRVGKAVRLREKRENTTPAQFASYEVAVNKLAAEIFGTFALVFAGCGAIIANQQPGAPVTHVGISLVFGLVVMALAYALGDISGAHLNPAVTIGFAAARRFSWLQVVPYILAQCLGALAAALLLRTLYPSATSLGQTLPAGEGGVWQSFVLEIVLTWLLMFVILRVSTGAKEKGIMAGAAVGATVALDALFGGPISGASMNPARSFGPALVAGDLDELWLYIAAPILGALLAVVCEYLVCPAAKACPPAGS